MSTLLEQASLVMIPSGYKEDVVYSQIPTDGSGDLSFTRASNGTRVNSAGIVEVCPWNLLEYSEQFDNATWAKVNATITANTTVAPNGTTTADTLAITSGGYLLQQPIIAISIGFSVTISIYAKNQTNNFLIFGGATPAGTDVYTIQDVGNGWYRHINTRTFTASGTSVQFIIYDQVGTNYIWGAQLNIGSTAKPYFPTTDRLNVPRLTYQNGGGGCPSLLLEKQSTNLVYPSEDFSAWNLFNTATISTNTTISPDGTQNADTLNFASSAISQVYSNQGDGTNTAHTVSIYAKSSSGKKFRIKIANSATGFDEFSSNLTTTSDWQRFDFTFTCPVTHIAICNESSGGTGTIQIWGAQLEASSYATSYIPTTSSSATRVADACYKTGISSLIGQSQGTMFVDVDLTHSNVTGGNEYIMQLFEAEGERLILYRTSSNQLSCYFLKGSTTFFKVSTITTNGRHKLAFAYKSGDSAFYIDGVQIDINTTTFSAFSSLSELHIGANFNPTQAEIGAYNYNEAIIFPTRLTNAELASLTTI